VSVPFELGVAFVLSFVGESVVVVSRCCVCFCVGLRAVRSLFGIFAASPSFASPHMEDYGLGA